jgi:DNA polymerase-1
MTAAVQTSGGTRMSHKVGGLPGFVKDPDPNLYWSDNYVVLDFETTTILKGSPLVEGNRIVLACWGRRGSVSSRFGSEYEQGELVKAIEGADFIIAHNAKFELGWLRRCGIDLRKVVVYDTLIGEYVLGGNRFNLVQLSLANSLKRYGLEGKKDTIGMMFKAGIDTLDMPESWLEEYCIRDVTACEELFLKQREKLKERGLIHLQYQRCLVSPALADIELNGMQLDTAKVNTAVDKLEDLYVKKTSELQEYMEGVSPTASAAKAQYMFETLKFRVPKDYRGKEMRTPSGGYSSAAPVIKMLRPQSARQREWLAKHTEWADMHSDVTKYLRKFKLCCDEVGGTIRAVFNQCNTKTHRLSSSGLTYKVQFQNLNRDFKPVFKARNEGWFMAEADGAQLEFRIAAHLGRDKQALSDIMNEEDIHKYTASVLHSVPESEVTGSMRQDAKPDTFKPLYGGQSGTPAQRAYYAAFAAKYSDIAKTQRAWANQVLENKKLVTEYGLIHYWPDCRMSASGYISYTTSIYNYPVQGFATAEVIPLAIVCAWHRMKDMDSFLVNTVHDSIIGEVHPDEVGAWHEIAQQCLIEDCYDILEKLYGIKLTVPLGAGVMVSTHWGDKVAKESEVVYNAPEERYLEAAKEAGML